MSRIKFLNTEIDNLSFQETIERVESLVERRIPSYVVTPNVDHIVQLEHDEEFKKIYQQADLILADGLPLIWISKLKGKPLKEKVSGSDLFPEICRVSAKKGYKLFFLGGAEGVADMASKNLTERYKGLHIVGTYSPQYGFENDQNEIQHIITMIKEASPDILAVALGAPKQEKFIYKYKNVMNVPVSLAIGASIDFAAGKVKRAPLWMQKIGLEWFYRLCREPRRMYRRYLVKDMKIIKIFFKYR